MNINNEWFFTPYDIKHMGVRCTGVRWSKDFGNIFRFEKDGENFVFEQRKLTGAKTIGEQIRKIIESQFLPWWSDKKIEDLQRRYDDLAKEFDRAFNYIKMMRKFSDNAED